MLTRRTNALRVGTGMVAVSLLVTLLVLLHERGEGKAGGAPLIPESLGPVNVGVAEGEPLAGDVQSRLQRVRVQGEPTGSVGSSNTHESIAELTGGRSVLCRVVDSYGAPVQGAMANVLGIGDPRSTGITDHGGECELWPGEAPGVRDVVVEAEGFVRRRQRMPAGHWQVTVELSPRVEFFGLVVDEVLGTGVSGARVALLHSGIDEFAEEVVTDERGAFGPLVVPQSEQFILTVEAKGFVRFSGQLSCESAQDCNVTIRLREARPLRCRFEDIDSKRAIEDVAVSTFGGLLTEWRSDASGELVMNSGPLVPDGGPRPVGLGKAYFKAKASGYCDVRFTVDLDDWNGECVVVPMVRQCELRLYARTPEGLPVQGARVFVACRSFKVDHAYWFYDRAVLPWPEHVMWLTGVYEGRLAVEFDENGEALLENLPPGLMGFDIFEDSGSQKVLQSSGAFSVAGEVQEVILTIPN